MRSGINIIEQGPQFMVLVSGFAFPEGRSFRMERTIEEATELRRDIQDGRVALRPVKQAFVLFEDEDEFAHPGDV